VIRIRIEIVTGDDRIVYDRTGKDPEDTRAVMAACIFGDAFKAIMPSCIPSDDKAIAEAFCEQAGIEVELAGGKDVDLLRN
jgi:hypothetical protein